LFCQFIWAAFQVENTEHIKYPNPEPNVVNPNEKATQLTRKSYHEDGVSHGGTASQSTHRALAPVSPRHMWSQVPDTGHNPRLVEERQRKIDEFQRQQLPVEQMQQGGSLYGQRLAGFNPIVNPTSSSEAHGTVLPICPRCIGPHCLPAVKLRSVWSAIGTHG
jgi:hypothetical protein